MEMYQAHQGAKLVRSRIESPTYEFDDGPRKVMRDAVNISASLVGHSLLLTAVNEDLTKDYEFDLELRGAQVREIAGRRVWSGDVRAHNTFESPETLISTVIKVVPTGGQLRIQLPDHSVTALQISLG
jgi:alpha-L-arabinofuranosidase